VVSNPANNHPPASGSPNLVARLASLVKFEHTIFALPFAFMGAVVAAHGVPSLRVTLLIVLAMVGARTAAMTFNRIVDVEIDRKNPRTARRELVTGAVSMPQARGLLVIACVLFLAAAISLNRLAAVLSVPALIAVLGYSLTKRFTALSHLALGFGLSIAPVGAWVAVTGKLDWPPIILAAAVMAWTAGFDIIYSLQDTEFDKAQKLHSLPAVIGESRALWVSRLLHITMLGLLAGFGLAAGLGRVYYAAVALVFLFLLYEHSLVSPQDKSRINVAFFTLNGVVSVTLFLLTLLDISGLFR